MIIVAYLYNTNGMAAWCWESAHSLAEAGKAVTLICAPTLELPETTTVNIVRFASPQSRVQRNKILREFDRLSDKSSEFVYHLHQHLTNLGLVPTVYLLNQSNLMDVRVDVPQHVVAWAYPTSITGYLGKIGKLSGWTFPLNIIRVTFDAVGWWRKDWRSYRQATSVLAVTKCLKADLSKVGVPASVVHPGTAIHLETFAQSFNKQKPYKLVICAQDLEEPRKRILFLLDALKNVPKADFCLTLIGRASDTFKDAVGQSSLPVTFSGSRRRDEVEALMAEHDIFLFGSCLDDWGYVLVEAMSQGLCVVAPKLSPFDEIVGDAGILYDLNSQEDLTRKLSDFLRADISTYREASCQRAKKLFSRQAFAKSLLAAVSNSA